MRPALAAFVLLALVAPAAAGEPVAIEVGRGPCCVVVSGGRVWVGNQRDATVQEIDPSSNAVVATVQTGPRSDNLRVSQLLDLVAAYGAVWATNGGTHRLYRIDSKTRAVRSVRLGAYVGGVTAAAGKVWVSVDHAALSRIDPRTMKAEGRIDLLERIHGFITSIAAGSRNVWVATDGGDVVQVDARTMRVRARLRLGTSLATTIGVLAGGSYWVVRAGRPTLFRISTGAAKVVARLPITLGSAPVFPALATAADGSLWLLPHPAQALELDPATGRIRTSLSVPLPDNDPGNYYPATVTVGFGSTWVASWPGARGGFADPTRGVVYRFAR
jgi:YVTN family beta-propeller protein